MNAYFRVIEALNQAGISFVGGGGFAALLHGNNRFTADLDLVVELSPENARRAVEALLSLGFRS